ncbi:MAG: hypothetical protein ABI700_00175 [Chloroflexota bacterium]
MTNYAPDTLPRLVDQGLVVIDASAEVAQDVQFSYSDSSYQDVIRIGKNCRIASGTILYSGAFINDNVQIGHHTVIGAGASIGRNSVIGNACVIGDDVHIGIKNTIQHHSVIIGRTEIGDNNEIGPFVTIGTEPQHPRIPHAHQPVRIGNNNVIREYCSVHGSAEDLTQIGNGCYIMAYNCINHDVIVDDHVTMANNCNIAGYVHIKHHANFGMGCVVHQYSVIGAGAMLGMGSIVTKDIPPYVLFYAGQVHRLNTIGIHRIGHSDEEIQALRDWYRSDATIPLNERGSGDCDGWWHEDVKLFLEKSHRKICDLSSI